MVYEWNMRNTALSLKENIESIANPLDKVMQLQGFSFCEISELDDIGREPCPSGVGRNRIVPVCKKK